MLVKEGRPRSLWLLDERLEQRVGVALPESLTRALEDSSAVAVDPRTGELVVASEASAACARLRIERRGLGYQAVLVKVLA